MTKSELVDAIAEKAVIRKKDAEAALNAFVEIVTKTLRKGKRVDIRGFGSFLMKERAARIARNPKTGKEVKVPPKLVPAFKVGSELKAATEKVIKKSKEKK